MQPAPVFAASPYLQRHYDINDSFKATRVYRQLGAQGFIVEKLGGATSQYTGLTPNDILGCLKTMRDEGNAGFLKAVGGILGTSSPPAAARADGSGLTSCSSHLHGVFSDLEPWFALIVALALANFTSFTIVQWIKATRYDAPPPPDRLTTASVSVMEHISSSLSSALRAFCCLGCFQLVGSSVLHVAHSALSHVDRTSSGDDSSSSKGFGGVSGEGQAWGPWGLLAGALLVGGGAFGALSVLRMPAVACSGAGAAVEQLLAALRGVLGFPGAGRARGEGQEGPQEGPQEEGLMVYEVVADNVGS